MNLLFISWHELKAHVMFFFQLLTHAAENVIKIIESFSFLRNYILLFDVPHVIDQICIVVQTFDISFYDDNDR